MMKFSLFVVLAVMAAALGSAKAFSKEDIERYEQDIIVHVKKCGDKFGISEDDIKSAKEDKDIEAVDPCFLGCVFKSTGVIGADGKFDPDATIENGNKYVSNEEDRAKLKEIVTECAKVNKDSLPDDKDGCERSKLLIACFDTYKDEIPVRR